MERKLHSSELDNLNICEDAERREAFELDA